MSTRARGLKLLRLVSDIEEETLLESDGDIGEEVHPLHEEHNVYDGGANKPTTYEEALNTNFQASDVVDIANTKEPIGNDLKRQIYDGKRLSRLNCFYYYYYFIFLTKVVKNFKL